MAVRGLGTSEVAAIRDGLAAGRRPRVVFTESAGQIAGQLGQVVGLTDPATSDEWVVVRFGKDELPFSPADLQVAPRGASARRTVPAATPPPPPAKPEPEFVIDKPVAQRSARNGSSPAPAPRKAGSSSPAPATDPAAGADAPAPPRTPASASVSTAASPSSAATAASQSGASTAASPSSAASAPGAPSAPAPRKAARPAKAKPPAGLTVTLSYTDGEWTVAASQGAKVLAKPYEIRPAEALRMVSLVDVPGVQEAVEQIMSAERAEAEQRAERLRAELAEIEARLAELRDAS
jgi:hypothetical protein